jgi:tetratricopeptide (TPR) repeat protein
VRAPCACSFESGSYDVTRAVPAPSGRSTCKHKSPLFVVHNTPSTPRSSQFTHHFTSRVLSLCASLTARMSQADRLKSQGNMALQSGQYSEAAELYTKAIHLDPSCEVYFSNRSAAYAGLGRWREALDDSYEVVTLKPEWVKGWVRRGTAFSGLGQHEEAVKAFFKATQLEPGNAQIAAMYQAAEEKLKNHKDKKWEDDLWSDDDEASGQPRTHCSTAGASSSVGSKRANAAGVADEADVAVKRAKRPKPGASLLAQLDRSLKDASEDSLRACLSQLASADEATCERVLHLLEGLNAASSEGSADEDGDNGGQGAAAWLGGTSWNRGSKLQRKAGQRRAGGDEDSD